MNHHNILDKEMSRREFVQHLGVGVFFLFGGGLVSQFFDGVDKPQRQVNSKGYGTRLYGS